MANKPALRTRYVLLSLGLVALVFLLLQLAIQSGATPRLDPSHGLTWPVVRQAVAGKTVSVIYLWLSSLPMLGMALLSMLGYGWQLKRLCLPEARPGLSIPLGLGLLVWLLIAWLTGLTGWLNAWTAWGLHTLSAGMALWHALKARDRGRWNIDTWPSPHWTLALALPAVILLMTAACAPPGTLWSVEAFGYDVMSYHLQLPRQWMADGRINGLEYQAYSYLPNLAEAGYLMLGHLAGRMEGAFYACAMGHVLTAIFAAWSLGHAVASILRKTSCVSHRGESVVAGVLFLSTPWVIVTGSLAYDEMVSLALILTGWHLLIADDDAPNFKRALLAGCLLGGGALAKLTMAAMLLPGMGFFALWPLAGADTKPVWRPQIKPAAWLLLGLLATMLPYLIRNLIWTGNPLFPLATSWLGRGHWTIEQATRWQAAHQGDGLWTGLAMLPERWLFSAGFASLGGQGVTSAGADITHFAFDGGLPVIPLLALAATVACAMFGPFRQVALGLLLMLLGVLLVWAVTTHHQSRFLLPTLVPMAALIALGLASIHRRIQERPRLLRFVNTGVALLLLSIAGLGSYRTFWSQTRSYSDEQNVRRQIPIYQLIDSLPLTADPQQAWSLGAMIGDHALNYLPPGSRTLMVADAGVLYVRSPIVYQSVFDPDPLAIALTQTGHNPDASAARLKQQGITHVWIHWSELSRLQQTYGYDLAIPPAQLRSLLSGHWVPLSDYGWATLYALPSSNSP